MIDRIVGPLLGRLDGDTMTERSDVPDGVVLRRGRWLPVIGGLCSGMKQPAAAVTIGRTIVIHPRARLSDALLRHELEHVRQWCERPFAFPLHYLWNHFRFGYRNNPYEVAARRAETGASSRETPP